MFDVEKWHGTNMGSNIGSGFAGDWLFEEPSGNLSLGTTNPCTVAWGDKKN